MGKTAPGKRTPQHLVSEQEVPLPEQHLYRHLKSSSEA